MTNTFGGKSRKEIVEDLASGGISFSGDSLARDLAFNSQCFLIQNMFSIALSGEFASAGNRDRPLYVESERQYGKGRWPSGYKYVSPILSDSVYGPAQQFSKLSHKKDRSVAALLNLTPSQQAQLVPLIRLYKIEYDSTEDGTPDL